MEYLKELRKEKIYQNSSENELYKLNEISNTIGNYINENKEELKPIESTLNLVTGEEKTNTEVNDSYGNKVIVPAGFKIINPEDNVTDGIIIQDIQAGDERSKGNQFVWIPVGTIRIDNRGNSKEVLLGRYTFDDEGNKELIQLAEDYKDETDKYLINDVYKELSNSTYGNTVSKNLGEFIQKTLQNGGYYIARYEAGDPETTGIRNASSSQEIIPVTKSGIYAYNYITQQNAANVVKKMYSNTNFTVDLINSYTWETAIVFIQTFAKENNSLNYSIQNGKNTVGTVQKTGEGILSSTNALDIQCNIYDMAGNVREWSTETSITDVGNVVDRGGHFSGGRMNTSFRYNQNKTNGFRAIIYL